MPWQFVGRTAQIEQITAALELADPGPIIITGEPGVGRSSLLRRVPDLAVRPRDEVIMVDPGSDPAALAAVTSGSFGARPRRRPVLVLDDAHLADHALVRMLRDAHRQLGAVVVVGRPDGAPEGALDCLRYEPGARFIALHPLAAEEVGAVLSAQVGGRVHGSTVAALHAATGGNPALLADLARSGGLAECMVEQAGQWRWRLTAVPGPSGALSERGTRTLIGALDRAWQALAFDQAEVLSALALSLGPTEQAAAVRAFLLLVRGRAREGLEFLDSLTLPIALAQGTRVPHDEAPPAHRLTLLRALLIGLGLGQVSAAEALLRRESAADPRHAPRLLAHRAWLLAVTGRFAEAAAASAELSAVGDAEATLFLRAAAATVALGGNRPAQAVSHLRRALIGAQRLRALHPWLPAFLTACLIDAALLAGRITEATALAADFHAAASGSGWDVAVALSTLITSTAGGN
jgi:hypothetical protein